MKDTLLYEQNYMIIYLIHMFLYTSTSLCICTYLYICFPLGEYHIPSAMKNVFLMRKMQWKMAARCSRARSRADLLDGRLFPRERYSRRCRRERTLPFRGGLGVGPYGRVEVHGAHAAQQRRLPRRRPGGSVRGERANLTRLVCV